MPERQVIATSKQAIAAIMIAAILLFFIFLPFCRVLCGAA
jgi:hypothetical protein